MNNNIIIENASIVNDNHTVGSIPPDQLLSDEDNQIKLQQ
jgi:hypothetical protein